MGNVSHFPVSLVNPYYWFGHKTDYLRTPNVILINVKNMYEGNKIKVKS